MADDNTNEDAFEEDTQLEAAADALEAEQNEQPGWWRWRKAAALVTIGKKADEPPPPPVEVVNAEVKKIAPAKTPISIDVTD